MGFQISLYWVDKFEKMVGLNEERDRAFEKWRQEQGHINLGDLSKKFPSYSGEKKISIRHKTYPLYPFKIGHIQMPYGWGIFLVLRSEISGVKYIFEPSEPGLRFRPDWLASLDRSHKLIEASESILQGGGVGILAMMRSFIGKP